MRVIRLMLQNFNYILDSVNLKKLFSTLKSDISDDIKKKHTNSKINHKTAMPVFP